MIGIHVPLSFDLKLLDEYPEVKGVQFTFPSPCRNVQSMFKSIAKLVDTYHTEGHFVSIHAPFWINVCNYNRRVLFKNSIRVLNDLGNLGADYVVTHVGCYYPRDEFKQEAIPSELFRESLELLRQSYTGKTRLLLENTSGNSLNSDPGMLKTLLELKTPEIGICVDTCHFYNL